MSTSSPDPIKILFLAANPSGTERLDLGEESKRIQLALRGSRHRERFRLEKEFAVSVSDLAGLLQYYSPHIVHFSGHGSRKGAIILEGPNRTAEADPLRDLDLAEAGAAGTPGHVSPRALSRIFELLKDNIRLVVLNACYSEDQARAIARHIDLVAGMSRAVTDRAAISFAEEFYQALGNGRDVRTAFGLGCGRLDLENLGEQDTPRLLPSEEKATGVVFAGTDAVQHPVVAGPGLPESPGPLAAKRFDDDTIDRVLDELDRLHREMDARHLPMDRLSLTLDALFDRKSFRGEPSLTLCTDQNWTARLLAAVRTHHVLEAYQFNARERGSPEQRELYLDLMRKVDGLAMELSVALFDPPVKLEAIRADIGTPEFEEALSGARTFPTGDRGLLVFPKAENENADAALLRILDLSSRLRHTASDRPSRHGPEPKPLATPDKSASGPTRQNQINIFVSYSSKDVTRAREFAERLRQDGLSVKRDEDFVGSKQAFNVTIEQELRRSDVVLDLLTDNSLSSRWVNEEIMFARELGKTVIPIQLDPTTEPRFGTRTLRRLDMSTQGLFKTNYPKLMQWLREAGTEKQERTPPSDASETVDHRTAKAVASNPFIYGNRVHHELFVGRAAILRDIADRVGNAFQMQSIAIVGNRRIGKSSLLNFVAEAPHAVLPSDHRYAPIYVDMMSARARSVATLMETLRRGLQRCLPADLFEQYAWSPDDNDRLEMCEICFEGLTEEGVRVILLLDEWEQVMAHPELNDWVEMLRSVGQQSLVGLVTSTAYELGRLFSTASELIRKFKLDADTSPFHNIFTTSYVGLMPREEWSSLVSDAFARGGSGVDDDDLERIGDLAGGHPLLTQLAGSTVWRARSERWATREIRQRFVQEAEKVFTDTWHKQTVPHQQEAMRQLLGIEGWPLEDHAFETTVHLLRMRGVVNDAGELFCRTFADFVVGLSRRRDS